MLQGKLSFNASLIAILLLFFAVVVPHMESRSSTGFDSCVVDILNIIPVEHTSAFSIVNSRVTSDPRLVGYAVIDGNLWGLIPYREQYEGYLKVYSDENGYFKVESKLNLASTRLNPWNVVGYPELYYGLKPWTPHIKPNMSKHLELPARLSELRRVLILVDYAILKSTTNYNFALDVWLLRDTTVRTPREGDLEVMIWLHSEDFTGTLRPAGRRVTTLKAPVLVDGKIIELDFEVWIQERIGDGWTYVAFVLTHSKPRGEIGLDLTFFLVKATEILRLNREDLYVYSIELGFELFYNPIVEFQASVYRYSIVVSTREGLEPLLGLTDRSKRLVAWITPWGHAVGTDEFSRSFTPGVVVAYDVECGLCSRSLEAWFSESLRYIKAFKNAGRVVFINLFPEKYHPYWRWRGELEFFVLNITVIEELKRIIGEGERVYLGFSELTACVNNEVCLNEVIRAYRLLKELFPAARLFYYGSGGDSVEALTKLYREAGLDLIGIDIWDYEYRNGRVYVASYLVDKLAKLSRVVPGYSLMVGEVGFRLYDREGYIEPWNKRRPIVYDETAHLKHYSQVLEHLMNIGLELSFLGIWAWNDDVYAIQGEPVLQSEILKLAKNWGLLPELICNEHREERELASKESSTPSSLLYALTMIAGLLLFLLVLKVLLKKRS
ncbi:MAG: hypothetical protein QW579_02645 [Desulfurococcaceae archaeon]